MLPLRLLVVELLLPLLALLVLLPMLAALRLALQLVLPLVLVQVLLLLCSVLALALLHPCRLIWPACWLKPKPLWPKLEQPRLTPELPQRSRGPQRRFPMLPLCASRLQRRLLRECSRALPQRRQGWDRNSTDPRSLPRLGPAALH